MKNIIAVYSTKNVEKTTSIKMALGLFMERYPPVTTVYIKIGIDVIVSR